MSSEHWLVRHKDKCYILDENKRRSFEGALGFCSRHNGHIIDINSQEEQDFIQELFVQNNYQRHIYIGYSDEFATGRFVLKSGSQTPYTNWGKNEPTLNKDHTTVCTVLNPNRGGIWKTVKCNERHTTLCEIHAISR